MQKWIYDLSYDELNMELEAMGLKSFVTLQVFQWLYGKLNPQVTEWSNISKINREKLSRYYNTALPEIPILEEDKDGTQKFLFKLADGTRVEAVSIKEKRHYTFCISTQVGCALRCKFCATGRLGFTRNLTPGEILSQVIMLKSKIPGYTGKINLVFMGMGEPLLNYDNLKKALGIIIAERGMSISPRNITVSTAGILEGIKKLEQDFPRLKISLSLNAADEATRESLMPINKKQKLSALLGYFRQEHRKNRVTFEYVMLKGINDSLEDAAKLVSMLKGIPCKINLIPYNENKSIKLQTPADDTVEAFCEYLNAKGFTVITRWSKGREIKSACGQLTAEYP